MPKTDRTENWLLYSLLYITFQKLQSVSPTKNVNLISLTVILIYNVDLKYFYRGTPALNLGLLNGEDPLLYIKRLFEEGSNKENLVTTPSKTQLTPTKTAVKTPSKGTPIKKGSVLENPPRRPLTCWADPSCPVHGSGDKVCWAFFKDGEDVDALILNLNKRGVRECSLRATLEDEREKIVQSISKCPLSRLNPKLVSELN